MIAHKPLSLLGENANSYPAGSTLPGAVLSLSPKIPQVPRRSPSRNRHIAVTVGLRRLVAGTGQPVFSKLDEVLLDGHADTVQPACSVSQPIGKGFRPPSILRGHLANHPKAALAVRRVGPSIDEL